MFTQISVLLRKDRVGIRRKMKLKLVLNFKPSADNFNIQHTRLDDFVFVQIYICIGEVTTFHNTKCPYVENARKGMQRNLLLYQNFNRYVFYVDVFVVSGHI